MSFNKRDGFSSERLGWQNLRRMGGSDRSRTITAGFIAILVLVVIVLLAWIGYGRLDQNNVRDWLVLLIVALIGLGGVVLFIWSVRRSEEHVQHELKLAEWYAQHERELEAQRFQEAAIQTYLDRMTELLLEKRLRRSKPGDEVRDIARARTLTTLRGLDGPHKGILVRFLHESDLITNKGIVDLRGANLRGVKLSKAQLAGADLSGADLSGADLSQADLNEANLSEAVMIVANLSKARLDGAHLRGASLTEAVANGASLRGADLSQTDLHGANLEGIDLAEATVEMANLSGAVMIDANLGRANLRKISLNRTNLSRANLREAILTDADLSWANLSWAHLNGANLSGAVLHGANLEGAEVVGASLREAKSLKGAKMPDGREHE